MQEKSFLGIGWSFPPTFNKERSDVEMTTKEEDIKQSLHIYFNTKLGERIMRQDFGCIIHEHLFDRLDKSILDVLTFELKQNIGNIEPRIIVNEISIMPIEWLRHGRIRGRAPAMEGGCLPYNCLRAKA